MERPETVSAVSGGAITALALFCAMVPPAEITNVWLFEVNSRGTVAWWYRPGIYREENNMTPAIRFYWVPL